MFVNEDLFEPLRCESYLTYLVPFILLSPSKVMSMVVGNLVLCFRRGGSV